MRRKDILFLVAVFISLLFIIFSLTSVFAINATSSNYSVGRFGTGLAATSASSDNYQAISITEARGTTRNADSDEYITNIGFFSDTPYHRTVSISSYSVYPKTSYAVSNIRLYISALNYESVWANITRPDSVVERIELTNNDYSYYTAGIIGRYNITFYANSSTGAISSVLDYFNVYEQPPSGGGSTGGDDDDEEEEEPQEIIVDPPCTYLWDCTPWSVCSNGKQTRECVNLGSCNGTQNRPVETMNCSIALFDVILYLNEINSTQPGNLIFKVNLTETMGVEKIDVSLKYSIINEEDWEIFSEIETLAVQGNLYYEKELSGLKLSDGEYTLRVDAIYGNLQRAFAEQNFKVINERVVSPSFKENKYTEFFEKINYHLAFLVVLLLCVIVVLLILIFAVRKKSRDKGTELIESNLKEGMILLQQGKVNEARRKYRGIKQIYHLMPRGSHKNSIYPKVIKFYEQINKTMFIGLMVLVPLLFAPPIINKAGITGNFIGTGGIINPMFFVVLSLILLFGGILLLGKHFKFSNKNTFQNTVSELLNKEVYSSDGSLIGKVKEVVLGKQKIHSLIITLNNKYNSSNKGIIVNYLNVKSIKNVIILDEKVVLSF